MSLTAGRVFTWGHGGNDGKLGLGDGYRGSVLLSLSVA
jgi:hypothetical protein